ncbi:MAG: poly(A) polymerase, partial [Thermoleophilaceae bacterium]|nr:poly(A) polymerase [Thermoleophilaceae bacterium]
MSLEKLQSEPRVVAAREAVGEGWIVGGTVRDALLGRPLRDLDLAVTGDPGAAAKAIARRLEAPAFQLSEEFGAWRVVTRDHAFTCDVAPLQGATIEEDLAHRDFAANAVAVPLSGGDPIDPMNGIPDIETRVLRVLPGAYESDSLRPLRLARLATELGFTPDQHTELLTLEAAHAVTEASPERIFAEL